MRRFTIPLMIALFSPYLGCSDDGYPVKECRPGQGLALETDGVPVHGDTQAPVFLTVFGDLKCPYTQNFIIALDKFVERLEADGKGAEFKWLFRHYVRPGYPQSTRIALALAAAHMQGNDAFWRLFWLLFATPEITDEYVLLYAEVAELDMEQFQADYESDDVRSVVANDDDLAREIGLGGTPGVVLCGKQVTPVPDDVIDNLEHLIYD
ncbi:MAG: thioredoxin domain-containing protein [Deltaproteobacteria bacterium]|nr:thioredoxin domain-containing protein [Deltaproteobacteria bacterium]